METTSLHPDAILAIYIDVDGNCVQVEEVTDVSRSNMTAFELLSLNSVAVIEASGEDIQLKAFEAKLKEFIAPEYVGDKTSYFLSRKPPDRQIGRASCRERVCVPV